MPRDLLDRADAADDAGATVAAVEPTTSARLERLALGLTLAPLLVAVLMLLVTVGDDYFPTSDWALTEMKVRDVGRHPVLIGLYSRDDWSHPGPLLFYLLALPYRLTGGSSVGPSVGALIINGVAIASMAVIARRRGGTPLLLLTLLGCGLVVRALGPEIVRNPWVCYVTVLPFGAMVFLTWAMTGGAVRALPVAAGLATFLVQTHVGYAALAMPLLAFGGVALLWRVFSGRRSESSGPVVTPVQVLRASLVAAAVLAFLWMPPLVDELQRSPGNLVRSSTWFADADEGVHTLAEGYRVVGGQFGLPPEWLGGARPPLKFSGEPIFLYRSPPPLLALAFVAAVVALWRRRAHDGLRLAATVTVGLALGVLAVARTVGIVYDYRLRWTWLLAMVAFVVVGWTLWQWAAARFPSAERRVLLPLAVGGVVVLSLVNGVAAAGAGRPEDPFPEVLGELTPPVVDALPDGAGDVMVNAVSPTGEAEAFGLVLRLERLGIDARVPGDTAKRVGAWRVHGAAPVRASLTVAADNDIEAVADRPERPRLVAYSGTQPRAERAGIAAAQAALFAEMQESVAAGEMTQEELLRRFEEAAADPAVAVFMERS